MVKEEISQEFRLRKLDKTRSYFMIEMEEHISFCLLIMK